MYDSYSFFFFLTFPISFIIVVDTPFYVSFDLWHYPDFRGDSGLGWMIDSGYVSGGLFYSYVSIDHLGH